MVETKGVETSFIPKQTLAKEFNRGREPMGLFMIIAAAVLVISLLFFGGTWGYRSYIESDIESLEVSLQAEREKLQHDLLLEFKWRDRQLARAESLLASHNTALPLFAFLEQQTLQTVRYNSLSYSKSQLELRGQAKSYESIALQSDEFGVLAQEGIIKDFIFSDLNLDNSGSVAFSLKMEIDPSLLSFVSSLGL